MTKKITESQPKSSRPGPRGPRRPASSSTSECEIKIDEDKQKRLNSHSIQKLHAKLDSLPKDHPAYLRKFSTDEQRLRHAEAHGLI